MLNSIITLPILTPNLSLIKTPRISEPSKTEPFLMAIPEPTNNPPKIEINNLSFVMV